MTGRGNRSLMKFPCKNHRRSPMRGAKMSSRERMLATLRREGADHVPFSPHIWQGPLGAGEFFWRNQVERAEKLLGMGLDPTIDIWLPDPQPHKDVIVKSRREGSGAEPILTKEYHTPAGVLRSRVRETQDWVDPFHGFWQPTTFGTEMRTDFNLALIDDHNIPRKLEPWVKGREDLEKLKYIIRIPEGNALDEWRMDAERAMEIARRRELLTMCRRTIVGDAFLWFCDVADFSCWMIEDPELAGDFFSIFHKWALDQANLALEVGVDVVQHRGWYEIPAYFGVRYYEEFILPRVAELANHVRSAGKLHSYLVPEGLGLLALLLKRIPTDVLQGVDPRMLHGGDLSSLYAQLGDRKAFWGGVGTEVTLRSQDPVRIDRAVKEAIEALGASGGLVLSAIFSPFIPSRCISYMIESWKKYRES